jgi:hypothetical protein
VFLQGNKESRICDMTTGGLAKVPIELEDVGWPFWVFDGLYLVTIAFDDRKTARIWNSETGAPIGCRTSKRITPPRPYIECVENVR